MIRRTMEFVLLMSRQVHALNEPFGHIENVWLLVLSTRKLDNTAVRIVYLPTP